MMRHHALAEDHALGRVKAKSHPIEYHLANAVANAGGIRIFGGQGMPIRHKEKTVEIVLDLNPVFQDTVIMADM